MPNSGSGVPGSGSPPGSCISKRVQVSSPKIRQGQRILFDRLNWTMDSIEKGIYPRRADPILLFAWANELEETKVYERHFTIDQIAETWSLSRDTVTRIFEDEPGVLVVQAPRGKRGRRGYRTFRVPGSVVERVHRRMSVAA
jgi:hypothetical protein